MTVTLVTGGAGFVGSHLVDQLVARGERVRVLDRPGVKIDHLPTSKFDIVFADIRDLDAVRRSVSGCSTVYHLAANPQLWTHRRGHFHHVNFIGAVNVLESAFMAGATRIIHTSTESVLTTLRRSAPIAENQSIPFGDVIGPYCRSKWRAERHAFRLAKAGAPVVVVNPTLPIGPGDWGRSPPTQMILDCCRGKRSAYLDADLNLIDVRDVAQAMIGAADVGQVGRRYLLGAENWSIHRLFSWVAEHSQSRPPIWRVPYSVALTAAYVDEFLADVWTRRPPAASVTGVKLTRRVMQFDASRSMAELGVTPRPVVGALRDALAWLKAIS